MASGWPALGPAEVMVLLDPDAPPRVVMKVALTSLLLKGVLRFEEVEQPGLLWTRRQRRLRQVGSDGDATPAEHAALRAIRAGGAPSVLRDVVSVLRFEFGTSFKGFRDGRVLPDLARRNLLARHVEAYWLLFARVEYRPTPAGAAEQERVRGLMERARRLPRFLAGNEEEALAVVAGLGTAILLVEELRPHFGELRGLLRPRDHGDGGGGGDAGSGAPGEGWPDWCLDAHLDGFGDAFDAAGDGGDGGGDGGGE